MGARAKSNFKFISPMLSETFAWCLRQSKCKSAISDCETRFHDGVDLQPLKIFSHCRKMCSIKPS